MNNPISLKPLVTEKSLSGGKDNNYTFKVALFATKSQIKAAVKSLFKVDPIKVRTLKVAARPKRAGRKRLAIKTQPTKKAIVTIKAGQKIEVLESTGK